MSIYTGYRIVNADTGMSYVGMTRVSLHRRWMEHCSRARTGKYGVLHDAMRTHGIDRFRIESLASVLDGCDRWAVERDLIAQWGTCGGGYNELPGIPRSLNDPGVPRCFTKDRDPMPESRKQRMRELFTGRIESAETKRRKSLAQRGNQKGNRPVVVDGALYPSIKTAAVALGVTRGALTWRLRHHRNAFCVARRAA